MVNVMFDTGSGLTLLSRKTAKKIGLGGSHCILDLQVAGGGRSGPSIEKEVVGQLLSLDQSVVTEPMLMITTETPANPLDPIRLDLNRFEWLKSYKFTYKYPQYKPTPVNIILCAPFSLFLTTKLVKGPSPNVPGALISQLGPMLTGGLESPRQQGPAYQCAQVRENEEEEDKWDQLDLIKGFASLESLGITPEKDTELSVDDQAAVELMDKITRYDAENKRWETGLLWRLDPNHFLDTNLGQASAVARMAKAKAKRQDRIDEMDSQFKLQIDMGYAEKVPEHEMHPPWPVH